MWDLADLRDRERINEQLGKDGAEGLVLAAEALLKRGHPGGRPALAFFVPGRVEVLGKHTDYAGGRSLVAATDRGFSLVVLPRGDSHLDLVDAARQRCHDFALSRDAEAEPGDWTCYPAAVVRRLARNFPAKDGRPELLGADVAFVSNLPSAAGMSSSRTTAPSGSPQ